jgi:tetratricopeptide (TPR) repeat protein
MRKQQQASRRQTITLAITIPALLLAGTFLYFLPPVHERLAPRLDELRTRIKYAINPPQQAIFIPEASPLPPPSVRTAERQPPTLAPPASPSATVPAPTQSPTPTLTPTITPTPLPARVMLEGVKYEDQHGRWNYCGPANLSMALTFWGWQGDRDVVGKAIKPNSDDKNVMPYEMQDFILAQAQGLESLLRIGGNVELLKRLVAGGFPVVAEKGYYEVDYTGRLGWLGHYQFVTGYDDEKGVLIVQDTYIKDGKDHEFPYADFIEGWRSFNYLFLVVFPEDRAADVYQLLGPYADPDWANRHALQVAQAEAETLSGIDQYFAYFNIGASHVSLLEYADATYAFDYAFSTLYPALPEDGLRPYRMLWYQTYPYRAYFYTGRYQDVINLANITLLDTISEPVLEESFYWRGLAKEALGDTTGAMDDLRQAVRLNPNFTAGWQQLERLGGG